MGKYQRDKGKRGEQELVRLLKEKGVPAKRISMLEAGQIDKGDVLIAEVWKAEVKIGGQVPKFIYDAKKEGEDFLICKRDRKEWLVVMDLNWFIDKFL